ncbi:MAG TPA: metal ABC transporter permease [Pirellulaceae bacterium]|nr:metal ABC transporter permease [Pirellulaceae bacterium]
MNWLLEPLEFGFMRQALLAGILVAITCSALGLFVVLRQMAFMGDAVAHTTLPGLVIAYLNRWNLFFGALIAAIVTAIGIGWLSRRQQLREDTAIGILFSGMFALGIVMISYTNGYRDLTHMLFGNILGVTTSDLIGIILVSIVVLGALLAFGKELILTSVDPLHSQVIGLSAERMRYLLLILLAMTVVTAIQAVGVVLTTALLITPAATASLLTKRMHIMFIYSASVAIAGCVIGLYSSWYLGISCGGAIVLACTSIFGAVFCIRNLAFMRW